MGWDTYPQCHESVVLVTRTVTQLGSHELGNRVNLRNQFSLSFVKPVQEKKILKIQGLCMIFYTKRKIVCWNIVQIFNPELRVIYSTHLLTTLLSAYMMGLLGLNLAISSMSLIRRAEGLDMSPIAKTPASTSSEELPKVLRICIMALLHSGVPHWARTW